MQTRITNSWYKFHLARLTFVKVTAKTQRGPGVCPQHHQDNAIAKH